VDKNKGFPKTSFFWKIVPVLALLTALSSITSCKDFFSTSLFPGAARDPGDLVPPVTTANVNELVKLGENDPDLALAVLQGINDALQDVSGDEASRLQAAAVTAAASAAAIGPSLLNNAGKIPESINQDKVIEFVKNSLESMSNLPAASGILLAIIPDPKGDKKAFDSFISAAKPGDLAMASVTLIAAEAKKQGGNIKDYIQSLDQSKSLSAPESLALKCAEEAVKKMGYGESPSAIRDILNGLNLI
jgi:hypothetical protein